MVDTATSKPASAPGLGANLGKWLIRFAIVGLGLALVQPYAKKYFAGGVNVYTPELTGKLAVVTGANTGIGFETAAELARLNATVILAGRDMGRVNGAVERIKSANPAARVEGMQLDLASFASVRAFAAAFKARFTALDLLCNNAGVMIPPFTLTEDGFELQFGTNHLGHFLLTELLLEPLLSSAAPRVITVSSMAHRHGDLQLDDVNYAARGYSRMGAYGTSKLANILFAAQLAKRQPRILSLSLHPGVIRTELSRHIPYYEQITAALAPFVNTITKSPWEGAQTQLHALLAPEELLRPINGRYLSDCELKAPQVAQATNEKLAEELWAFSERAVAAKAA